MELRAIWEILVRRKWIVIQAVLVVAAGALLFSSLSTSVYIATSRVLLLRAKKGVIDIGAIGSQLASVIQTTSDVDVNRVLALSKPMLDKVVFNLQLRDDQGELVKVSEPDPSFLRSRLSPRPYLSVSQYKTTDILNLRAFSVDPIEAAMMANALAEAMVLQNQDDMRAEYRSARIFLQNQVDLMRSSYDSLLKDMLAFQIKEKTIDLGVETKLAAQKAVELLKEKEDNVIDLAEARAKLGRLNQQLANQTPDYVSASALSDSPQIGVIKKRLTELRLQIAEAQSELTPMHPKVQALRKQIGMAEAELKREIAAYQASAPELMQLERQIASLEAHLEEVNKDIERYFKELGGIPDKVYQQASLDKEINVARHQYSTLLDFLHQLGIAEAATLAEIRLIEQAQTPRTPDSPSVAVSSLTGGFLGLLLGVGLALVLEYLDDTIRKAADVKVFQPVPLIGVIPRFESEGTPLISGKDRNDPIYESYRTIRSYLGMSERRCPTLLITSAGPKEGRSITAANLGICLAHEGRKVALVDVDLRRPALHGYFQVSNYIGVMDFLSGSSGVESLIQQTWIEGLSVVPSGSLHADAGRLIESDRMAQLVLELKSRFDAVIFDVAPVLVKSDALVLAKHVDGAMVVLDSGKTTRRAVFQQMEAMDKARVRPLGFILNGFVISKGKYFYHQYYYGGWQKEAPAGETYSRGMV